MPSANLYLAPSSAKLDHEERACLDIAGMQGFENGHVHVHWMDCCDVMELVFGAAGAVHGKKTETPTSDDC